MLNSNDNDLTAIQNQLTKARAVWGKIGKILKMRADSNIRIMSIFYKVIIQTVLLYGAESWVLNKDLKCKLRSFHHRSARFLTGRYITKIDDEWVYPETKKTLELAHLLPIDDYIMKRKQTIATYALQTAIYKECINKSLYIKNDNSLQWWTDMENDDNEDDDNNNNNDDNNNNNNINITQQYDNYDPNEIEIIWCTEEEDIINNEVDNRRANSEMENNFIQTQNGN